MTVNNKALGENITEENITEKVWFVDVVTEYGPGHFVPTHITLERCTEILNAGYLAVVDQNCQLSIGTEKWVRVLHNSRYPTLEDLTPLAKQRQYYRAFVEIKTQLSAFCELSIWIRSLLKNIKNNATYIIIYLDSANPLQILAVWLSVVSLVATRGKTIVWTHFHATSRWQETKIGRFVRCLFNVLPIKTWRTAYTSEIAAENRKYGWVDILPLPLNPALNAGACNHKSTSKMNVFGEKSDKLVCWLLITRPEQGLEFLPRMIAHKSTSNFPRKFIKCFVSEKANITENAEIELVRLPYGSEDYHLHFNECEVVLLPYNAYAFKAKMSMVFIEAVATSKIPVVSDGTAMASELRRFKLEDLVLDFSNKFSWTLINEIRRDGNIRARLNLMAESYNRDHDTVAYAQSIYKNLKQIDSKMTLAEPKRA